MPTVQQSVLVSHSGAEMFALIDAVEDYPVFLPWCGGTTVHERTTEITDASIQIRYASVSQSFRTRNQKSAPREMQLTLVEGPFRDLRGEWRITPLSETGCKVEFSLQYSFDNAVIEAALGPVFATISKTLVDRFVERAEAVYSASAK